MERSTHIYDTSRVEIGLALFSTLVGGSSKERQAFLGEGEYPVKVQRQDFSPSLVLRNPIVGNQQPSRKTWTWGRTGYASTLSPQAAPALLTRT